MVNINFKENANHIYNNCCIFAVTVHTTLPIGTAFQGVSFAFIPFVKLITPLKVEFFYVISRFLYNHKCSIKQLLQ